MLVVEGVYYAVRRANMHPHIQVNAEACPNMGGSPSASAARILLGSHGGAIVGPRPYLFGGGDGHLGAENEGAVGCGELATDVVSDAHPRRIAAIPERAHAVREGA